jgi:hypothetical protein
LSGPIFITSCILSYYNYSAIAGLEKVISLGHTDGRLFPIGQEQVTSRYRCTIRLFCLY